MNVKKLSLSGVDYVDYCLNIEDGCSYCCGYSKNGCFAKCMMKRWGKSFEPQFHEERMSLKLPASGIVFVTDMGDLFGDFIPDSWLYRVLEKIVKESQGTTTTYLFCTKNPARYKEVLEDTPIWNLDGLPLDHFWFGATTDFFEKTKAPPSEDRLQAILELNYPRKWLSLEPMMLGLPLKKTLSTITPVAHQFQWLVAGLKSPIGKVNHDILENINLFFNIIARHEHVPIFAKGNLIKKDVNHSWYWPRQFPEGINLATKSADYPGNNLPSLAEMCHGSNEKL